MDKMYTDVAIIGGGAAGLAAGSVLAQDGNYSVIILEHGPRTGKKILATGNGRCNLSHAPVLSDNPAYHGELRLAERIIGKAAPAESFFNKLGLLCRTDEEGRVYPYSNTAASVVDALRLALVREGVRELCSFTAASLEPLMEGFIINPENTSDNPRIIARRVILATGGKAQSNMDGFHLLNKLGIKTTPLYPSLCPLKTDERTRSLKGLRIRARVNAVTDGKTAASEIGEVQFGDGVLSGIAVFNLSRLAFAEKNLGGRNKKMVISLDLTPEMDYNSLHDYIKKACIIRNNAAVSDLLTGLFPKRVGEVLVKQITEKPLNALANTLNPKELTDLTSLIKNWEFPVERLSEDEIPSSLWQSAQVTYGGIPSKELGDDLSIKKYKGLYAAGEIINVSGDCGGYNLAWAWASGEIAAKSVLNSLRAEKSYFEQNKANKSADSI